MDITKCKDQECPMKEACYRFTAPADILQSYFVESPRKGTKCDMYWGQTQQAILNQLNEIVNGTTEPKKES